MNGHDDQLSAADRLAHRLRPEAMRAACVSSCPFTRCTGSGSTAYNAHACSWAPDVVRQLGPCSIDGCDRDASTLLPAGRRCPGHTPAQPRRLDPLPRPERAPVVRPVPGPRDDTDPTARPYCDHADCQRHDVAHRHGKRGRRG